MPHTFSRSTPDIPVIESSDQAEVVDLSILFASAATQAGLDLGPPFIHRIDVQGQTSARHLPSGCWGGLGLEKH